jgi:glycosyltransferase involved in cell wall biosynthesis
LTNIEGPVPSVPLGAGVKPRVLQVGKFYPPHMGGIETHLRTLCHELRDAVDVQVVVANDSPRLEEGMVDGIEVARLGTQFTLAAAPVCPDLVRRLRTTDADIVHVHLPNPTAVLAYLMSGHKGRLVVSYHSDVIRQRVLERLFRPFLLQFLRRADAIVVATPNHIDSSPVLSEFRDRCTIIPYGIAVPDGGPRDRAAVARIREQYGPRLVLGVGRLVYYKGFKYLIRAMKSLDARLLLIGEGPLRGELEAEAREQGVKDRVVFLGGVEDLTPFYRAADLFVLPSVARSEAFGIVQLEAMACGTPVVNTSLDTGVPYVSLHNVSGLTVPPENVEALSLAIRRIIGDEALRAAFQHAARERVEQEFTKEVMASRMLRLYSELLSDGTSAAPLPRQQVRGGPNVRRQLSFTDSSL